MTSQECVFQIQEMLPLLPMGWRLEIYHENDRYDIQVYCYDGDSDLLGTEGYAETLKQLKEILNDNR